MRLTLPQLADRAMIVEVLNRYAQGVDQRDWALYDSAFAEHALIEVPGYLEQGVSPAHFRQFLQHTFDGTRLSGQHLLGNTRFEFREDEAHTVTEFLAVNVERSGAPDTVVRQVAAGLYVDQFVRQCGAWRIRRRILARKSENTAAMPLDGEQAQAIERVLRAGAWFQPDRGRHS